MGSMLGNWPSYDPHNFSQLRLSDKETPCSKSSLDKASQVFVSFNDLVDQEQLESGLRSTPETYHPTHNRTLPPTDQVISTERKNILIRHLYTHAEEKLRPKRAAAEFLAPESGSKHQRPSNSDTQQ